LLADDELRVSLDAHVILPTYREIDGGREDAAAGTKIGTTRRGVGPAYEAKMARRGVRVRDLLSADALRDRLRRAEPALTAERTRLGLAGAFDVEAAVTEALAWGQWLAPMVCDAGQVCVDAIAAGQRVLFEGAQGAMLDVDHGTYPYVTSSSTIAGGVCTGMGIGPTLIDAVWGISKAYTTRVGAGPFPTKLDDAPAEALRRAGAEFGATTGRPRDCGWLDLPALRYAARLSGMTGLCITKLDVLAKLPQVQICDRYEDGREPGRDVLDGVRPHLRTLSGWGDPAVLDGLLAARGREDLPAPVRAYLDLVEEQVGVAIVLLSVGPSRDQTLMLCDAFEPGDR
jgi:adenylosuccinate synthase